MEELMYINGKPAVEDFAAYACRIVKMAVEVNLSRKARVNVHVDNGHGLNRGSVHIYVYGGDKPRFFSYHDSAPAGLGVDDPNTLTDELSRLLVGKEVVHA